MSSNLRRLFPLTLCVTAWSVACGDDAPLDDVGAIEQALEQHFGGLTEVDEDPMFGEQDTYEELGEASEDPAESADPAVDPDAATWSNEANTATGEALDDTIPEVDRPAVYGLLISWGRQVHDTTADVDTVWDPTISTDCGFLVVRRRIAMEQGEGVVRPRTSRQSVSFTSATRPSFDGVALVLVIPPAQLACADTGMLRFESAALEAPIEVPLDDTLANTVLRLPLDDGNNVVALAHKLEPPRGDACVRGHIVGRWTRAIDSDGRVQSDLGRFYGRVIGELGALRGHIKGIYGIPKGGRLEGRRVFFGKYINRQGEFAGLLAGGYRPLDTGGDPARQTPDGRFGGGWHLRPQYGRTALRGLLGGGYVLGSDDVPDGGQFRGRYASLQCLRQITEDPIEDIEE
ncbi:MAG: hypothetical protein V3T05_06180 [Myxococcota bacterium]